MWKKKNNLIPIQRNKNEENGAQLKVEELRKKNGRNKEKGKRRESNTRRKWNTAFWCLNNTFLLHEVKAGKYKHVTKAATLSNSLSNIILIKSSRFAYMKWRSY